SPERSLEKRGKRRKKIAKSDYDLSFLRPMADGLNFSILNRMQKMCRSDCHEFIKKEEIGDPF
ncbi:MAG: hypothetical protein AAF939_21400, partial [Planctomycetota bacterium]